MDADVRNIVKGGSFMPTSEDVGGSGGDFNQPTTRDVRLLSRALQESWDIPDDTRRAMLDRLGSVVKDPQAKLRAVVAASKVLAGLSRINLTIVDTAIRAELHEQLTDRVEALEAKFRADQKVAS
jgi:hypothetical protein